LWESLKLETGVMEVVLCRAAEILDKCVANYRDFFNSTVSLRFSGLKTFGREVRIHTWKI
jgi:hypothetical protein